MEAHTNEPTPPQDLATQHQDWGRIIGTGIAVLVVLVIVVNLFTYEPAAATSPYAKVTIPAHWIQIGRWVGLLVSLGGGGWLLRQMFRQRQTVERTSLTPLLQQAIGYTHQIEELLKVNPNQQQQQLLAQIHTWQPTIKVMVQTLTDLGQNDHIIQRDLRHLPGMIADLEQQLADKQQQLDSYRSQVSDHFKQTSELVQKMTESYRDVYEHLASGSQALCQDPVATPQLDIPQQPMLQEENETPPGDAFSDAETDPGA